jgi:hypothetical protein
MLIMVWMDVDLAGTVICTRCVRRAARQIGVAGMK